MKYIYSALFILIILVGIPHIAYAQDVGSLCGSYGGSGTSFDTPPVATIICTGLRIFNFAFFLVGGVFVVMFLFGMYKYATAWGDPKGIQGAQHTATYAVIGAIVCFGAGTILVITGKSLGLNDSFVGGVNPFDRLLFGVCNLLSVADLDCSGVKRY